MLNLFSHCDLDLYLPNFFIVGATRCGTSSLYEYFNKTPGIFMSKIKEPAYFSISINRRKHVDNENDYLKLFQNAKSNQPIGEATTRYFIDPKSSLLIKDKIPNSKIIILLRDPVERAFSSYLYYLRREKKESFNEIIKKSMDTSLDGNYLLHLVVNGGLYYESVKRYVDLFGRDSVKILFFEEFFIDIKNNFKDLLQFLDVESEPTEIVNSIFNEYKKPKNKTSKLILSIDDVIWKFGIKSFLPFLPTRKSLEKKYLESGKKPKISEKDKNELIHFYHDDVNQLKSLLGRNLPWKNFI